MEAVELVGVYPVGPEQYLCALLQRSSNGRCMPVWVPTHEGGELAARLSGWSPIRPRTIDAVVDLIRNTGKTVETIELSSYLEGMFMATVSFADGSELDLRASDALLLALELDHELSVDDLVASQASIYLSPEDAQRFLGAELKVIDPQESVSASGDAQADADFEELMRNLGVDDLDTGDTPDTDGDDGADETK